jgi:hypothetical protein
MDIFVKGLNILLCIVSVCADGFQGLTKVFHFPIQLLIYFASLKLLINIENAY